MPQQCLAPSASLVVADWLFVPHRHQPVLFEHMRSCRGVDNPAALLADGMLLLDPQDGLCTDHPVPMIHVEQCVGDAVCISMRGPWVDLCAGLIVPAMHTVVNRIPALKIAVDYTPCDRSQIDLAMANAVYRSSLARAGWRIDGDAIDSRPDMAQLPSALAFAWLATHRDDVGLQRLFE